METQVISFSHAEATLDTKFKGKTVQMKSFNMQNFELLETLELSGRGFCRMIGIRGGEEIFIWE